MTAALSPLVPPDAVPPANPARPWPHACLLFALAGLLAAYWATAATMVNQWWHSQTFAHGFVVPPICIWLIWRQRAELAGLPLRPSPLMLFPLAVLGALWCIAAVAN